MASPPTPPLTILAASPEQSGKDTKTMKTVTFLSILLVAVSEARFPSLGHARQRKKKREETRDGAGRLLREQRQEQEDQEYDLQVTAGEDLGRFLEMEDPENDEEPDDWDDGFVLDWNNIEDLAVKAQVDFLIGGAGMAGIGAARKILQLDPDATLVLSEARGRIGGRIDSVDVGRNNGFKGEIGATFISGLEGNPIFERANSLGIFAPEQDFDPILYKDEFGNRDRDEEDYEEGTSFGDMDLAYSLATRIQERCIFPGEGSPEFRKKFCRKNTDGVITEAKDDDDYPYDQVLEDWAGWAPENYTEARSNLAEVWYTEADYGIVNEEIRAAAGLFTYTDFADGDKIVADKRGYKHIAKSFLSDVFQHNQVGSNILITDDRLWLKTKIVAVKWDPSDMEDATIVLCKTRRIGGRGKRATSFRCKSKRSNYFVVKAKKFISTFPTNVLRKSLELEQKGLSLATSLNKAPRFKPFLQSVDGLADALTAAEMGYLAGTFLQFKHSFWGGKEYLVFAASRKGFIGTFTPYWTNFNHRDLYPGSNTLKLWSATDRALDLESKPHGLIKKEVVGILNDMFPTRIRNAYGRPLRPSDILFIKQSRWSVDELTRGGYTGSRLTETPAVRDKIKEFKGNFIPAGEFTCERYTGYTHGALLSGERVAQMLYGDTGRIVCEDGPAPPPEDPTGWDG